jgi:hypothetical protein
MANIFKSKRVLNTISMRKQNIFCEWKLSLLKIYINYVSKEMVKGILFVIIVNNFKVWLFALLTNRFDFYVLPTQLVCICFAWISEKGVIIFLYTFSWFIHL